MRTTFPSKIDLVILIPVAIFLLAIEILMIINHIWISSVIIGLLITFIFYLCLTTFYLITKSGFLVIKCGFLINKKINIKRIKKLSLTKDTSASPALSVDRLEIFYNENNVILISPKQKEQFIISLKNINPDIQITEDK